jgi:hypothetical protein
MNAALIMSAGLIVMAMPQNAAVPGSEQPREVTALIEKLPECSLLRQELNVWPGDGIQKPYMRPMLDHGVQRIYFEIEGAWRDGRSETRIVRRLYYRYLDEPGAQIADEKTLTEIKNSGLEAMLDDAVLAKGNTAHLFAGIDRWAGFGQIDYWRWRLTGSRIRGAIELFASAWMPSAPYWVYPGKYRENVAHAAEVGDVTDLSKLLSAHRNSQSELNSALKLAVMSPSDNSSATELLIRAGADVNAKFAEWEDRTALMVANSCNIPVLLAHGARVDDRDKSGRTALDLARQRRDMLAIRLLETPGTKP